MLADEIRRYMCTRSAIENKITCLKLENIDAQGEIEVVKYGSEKLLNAIFYRVFKRKNAKL